MSFDRTEQEYHLTPSGWITGSFLVYGEGEKIEPPVNRVETWVVEKYQSSGFASESITQKCIWVSPNYSESEREALKAKFPFPKQFILKQANYGKRRRRH